MDSFICEPFGTVTISRRLGARSIRIKIEADSLRISADCYTTDSEIFRLLEKNKIKIAEKQNRLKLRKKPLNERFRLSKRYFSLSIEVGKNITKRPFILKADNNTVPYHFTLKCSRDTDFSSADTQERISAVINKLTRNIAKEPLETRTFQLAERFGFSVNSVKTKIVKSKWGSCSSKGNINLSACLILLPDHLRDYIITHELCHLKEMNHGKKFHELVNRFTEGREKDYGRELKEFSTNILDYGTET